MTPQMLDGEMMEPRVSVPSAKPTRPAAVAAHGPADEPLEPVSGFHGLRVVPPNQTPPWASAPIESLATSTAPASRSRSTTVASDIDHLLRVRRRAPGGLDAFGGEQILGAPRDAVQRAAIPSGLQIAVGLRGLREREIFGQRHDAVERVAVLLERARYIFVRSVDVTRRLRMSARGR